MFAQIRPVVPLLVSAMLMVSGVALGNLLVPLRAHAEGWSASTIGVLSTCYSFSFTLGCIFMPRLVMRVGHVRVFGVILAMAAASLIMIPMMVSQPAWAALRALTGFCISGGYMIIESWLNERSTNTTRGAVLPYSIGVM